MFELKNHKNLVKIWSEQYRMESEAFEQIKHIAELPYVFNHVAIMPDVHVGYGVPIGSVFASKDVVVPNAVSNDCGCGMHAVKTSLTNINEESLLKIREEMRKVIPLGRDHHKESQNEDYMPNLPINDLFIVKNRYDHARKQVGTLGGGNHFIEVQKGNDGHIWFMIHSGSRNLGLTVATHYNKVAQLLNKEYYSPIPSSWDLAFLPLKSDEGKMYRKEMEYCIDFAKCNRELMSQRIKNIFISIFPDIIFEEIYDVAHNYAAFENHFGENVMVHRKGATRARKNEIGIIPGSQGTKSYIVKGLGNPDSFMSCSHGAGRQWSRSLAKEKLNLDEEQFKMKGIIHNIETISDLDEAPGAYKNIDRVMKNQEDLVEPLVELTPLMVLKG